MLDGTPDSFLNDAGPLPRTVDTHPDVVDHGPGPYDEHEAIAALVAKHGIEGVRVSRESPLLIADRDFDTVVITHEANPAVRLVLSDDDPVGLVREVAHLFQAIEQAQEDREEQETVQLISEEYGRRGVADRQRALEHLLLGDALADFVLTADALRMLPGAPRDKVLARLARIQATLTALPTDAWLPKAPPTTCPACLSSDGSHDPACTLNNAAWEGATLLSLADVDQKALPEAGPPSPSTPA